MIQEHAPAKINLGLAVTGKLKNGYHTLDTLFCTLDVGDNLWLEPSANGVELQVIGLSLPTNQDNLVFRAAIAYLEATKVQGGVRIKLEKRLPIAAGLGGGSSDAAACLRGLQRLYPSNVDLHSLATALGADVPFLLRGGVARASGIGEVLQPLALPEIHVVLVNPAVGITAKEAYLGLNGRFGEPLEAEAIVQALEEQRSPPYRNDLEAPVLTAYPIVQEVKNALVAAGLFGVLMSGSGSTCFGLARDATQAQTAARALQVAHPNWWVCATKSQAHTDMIGKDHSE
jgi:4-diphosphocytidyl-2-C-methyl-D-erythritol kinase